MTGEPSHVVAPVMLGWVIETTIEGRHTALEITEVEAYDQSDPASHSYRGVTARTASMFEQPATLYVYRSYGLHWCANVSTGAEGHGAAVLLRAGEPVAGLGVMVERRGRSSPLARGPGMLTQALGIVGAHDGVDLFGDGPVSLRPTLGQVEYDVTPRIGITRAVDQPWRFVARRPAPHPDGPESPGPPVAS